MQKVYPKKRKIIKVRRYDNLEEMIAFIEKNFKKHPHLDVVKWMAKHGR